MLNIKTEQKSCVELFVGETSVGLFVEKSKWNGLSEIRRITDQNFLVIGDTVGTGFNRVFGNLFNGEEQTETYIVNGSADLIAEIQELMDNETEEENENGEA
ncbi:MAG: hypothetical protein KAS32_05535 [Candidatus Peribacteraceae bacterium]|nr:hypothetical protein [Candidatus Peribacteraceae bacterium]